VIHTEFSPGCDRVAQKCVIRAQKCAIMRHLAQRSEPLGAQRRPHEAAAAADGGDRLIGVGSRPIEVAEGESNRVWE
jgi:hypothetical protein